MFEYLIFTYFFEINGVLQKKHFIETGTDCPYEFRQINEPRQYEYKYQIYEKDNQLKKKPEKEIKMIAKSCREKHNLRKD